MTTVLNINMDDIDTKFVESLKRDFAHASVEIRLDEQFENATSFREVDFWKCMELLDWNHESDDDAVIEPLISFLTDQSIAHIYRFSDVLSEKLWQLDTYEHAKVFLDDPEEEGILSVDDFLYTRCAVVANGQLYYENVLKNPGLMPADLGFEPLLYIAMKAYKRKTGKDFMPTAAYNYETYSNKKGWQKPTQI